MIHRVRQAVAKAGCTGAEANNANGDGVSASRGGPARASRRLKREAAETEWESREVLLSPDEYREIDNWCDELRVEAVGG